MMQQTTFGDKIKQIRLSRGDSVRKVALYAGISASYYSQVENGKRQIPKPDTLRKIAKGLHISESQIFKLANLIPTKTGKANIVTMRKTVSKMPPQNNSDNATDGQQSSPNFNNDDFMEKFIDHIRLNNRSPIPLVNTRAKLQIPDDRHAYTQLSAEQSSSESKLFWLKIVDANLTTLGILKNDLAVIDPSFQARQLILEHPKLVAVNLTSSKTIVRQALLVTADKVMLSTGSPTGKNIFLTLNDFTNQMVGAVINLYRDVH